MMDASNCGKSSSKPSSSSSSFSTSARVVVKKQYEAPLGYGIEDVRPFGGVDPFRSAEYSNVSPFPPCK